MSDSEKERQLLYHLQRGLPLEPRPFASIGSVCGCSETEAVEFMARILLDGKARRFGAIFDGRRLGYQSALCALSLPEAAALESVAPALSRHPGVTHCYERGWPAELDSRLPYGPNGRPAPNLWLTLSVLAQDGAAATDALRRIPGAAALLVLPARTRFKVDVVFDQRTRDRDERFPGSALAPGASDDTDEPTGDLSASDRAVVRLLQGNLPPVPDVFSLVAKALGMSLDELLGLLRDWQTRGVLRRIALVVRHRGIGFAANAMCVWRVPEADVGTAGRRLAGRPEVTHCYERLALPAFPYNLYAMIHAADWKSLTDMFERLQDCAGLRDGRMLCSLREFKKSSMQYFADEKSNA